MVSGKVHPQKYLCIGRSSPAGRPPCLPAPLHSTSPSSPAPRSWVPAAGSWHLGQPPALAGPRSEAWRCRWSHSQVGRGPGDRHKHGFKGPLAALFCLFERYRLPLPSLRMAMPTLRPNSLPPLAWPPMVQPLWSCPASVCGPTTWSTPSCSSKRWRRERSPPPRARRWRCAGAGPEGGRP